MNQVQMVLIICLLVIVVLLLFWQMKLNGSLPAYFYQQEGNCVMLQEEETCAVTAFADVCDVQPRLDPMPFDMTIDLTGAVPPGVTPDWSTLTLDSIEYATTHILPDTFYVCEPQPTSFELLPDVTTYGQHVPESSPNTNDICDVGTETSPGVYLFLGCDNIDGGTTLVPNGFNTILTWSHDSAGTVTLNYASDFGDDIVDFNPGARVNYSVLDTEGCSHPGVFYHNSFRPD